MSTARRFLLAAAAILLAACGTAPSARSLNYPVSSPGNSVGDSVRPTASPSARPSPNVAGEIAAFGAAGEIETVLDVADTPFGLISVGRHYSGTALQVFGSVPDEARIWQSDNGYEWRDVTPADISAASLDEVETLPDGSVMAFGGVVGEDDAGMPMLVPQAFVSRDGTNWQKAERFIGGHPVLGMVSGGRGHLALVATDSGRADVWHARDLWDFQRVFSGSVDSGWGSISAGPEGFVVVQMTAYDGGVASTVRASGDGVTWFEATSGAADVQYVAPLGPDWVALGPGAGEDHAEPAVTTSWFSTNALEWRAAGELALDTRGADGACQEYVSRLIGAGDVVIASTVLSYPCGEGGVVRYGHSSVTADGATWNKLPFVEPIAADTRGATVNSAIPLEEGALLVGERDFQAVFWLLL